MPPSVRRRNNAGASFRRHCLMHPGRALRSGDDNGYRRVRVVRLRRGRAADKALAISDHSAMAVLRVSLRPLASFTLSSAASSNAPAWASMAFLATVTVPGEASPGGVRILTCGRLMAAFASFSSFSMAARSPPSGRSSTAVPRAAPVTGILTRVSLTDGLPLPWLWASPLCCLRFSSASWRRLRRSRPGQAPCPGHAIS